MRRILTILLMLCLPLQTLAMQCERVLAADMTMLAHVIEHDNRVLHHHGDDGSVHYDDSDESAKHVLDHSCSPQPAGMLPPMRMPVPVEFVSVAPPEAVPFVPDPLPDLPLRPPAFSLG